MISKNVTRIAALAAIAFGSLSALPAQAYPKYAQKEKKPCAYCHTKPQGGGPRNAAGMWYQQHGHTLVGFVPGAAAKPAKPNAPKPKPAPKKPAGKKG